MSKPIEQKRGYFGMGIYHVKNKINIGTLWRSADIFGASFIFTIGKRYKKQGSDTKKTYRHIPLWHFLTYEEFKRYIPYNCQVICIELSDKAISLNQFAHPERAIYLLGAEDGGLPIEILKSHKTIQIPTIKSFCLNVSTAGSIVMYDRLTKNENK